jgi:hypothetical protein
MVNSCGGDPDQADQARRCPRLDVPAHQHSLLVSRAGRSRSVGWVARFEWGLRSLGHTRSSGEVSSYGHATVSESRHPERFHRSL